MSAKSPSQTRFRVSQLSQNGVTEFIVSPDAGTLAALATELGLESLRKLTFKGRIVADGSTDWRLDARLGATVVQPCVVTLAPVTTRIEEKVTRRFVNDFIQSEEPEVEMPDDDTIEPLGTWIDVASVMAEALALALPLYPRAQEGQTESRLFAAPGTKPMSDDDARPFAGLADFRDALDKSSGESDS